MEVQILDPVSGAWTFYEDEVCRLGGIAVIDGVACVLLALPDGGKTFRSLHALLIDEEVTLYNTKEEVEATLVVDDAPAEG